MKIEKKHIIFAGLGVVSLALAGIYWQYTKLLNYCLSVNRIKINTLNDSNADINLYLNFENKSDSKIEVISQSYDVSINGKQIVHAGNKSPQTLMPKSTSVIGVNIKFNPKQAGQNILNILATLKPIEITFDIKLAVKLWVMTINIPYTYTTTLRELMAPSTTPKSNTTCK